MSAAPTDVQAEPIPDGLEVDLPKGTCDAVGSGISSKLPRAGGPSRLRARANVHPEPVSPP